MSHEHIRTREVALRAFAGQDLRVNGNDHVWRMRDVRETRAPYEGAGATKVDMLLHRRDDPSVTMFAVPTEVTVAPHAPNPTPVQSLMRSVVRFEYLNHRGVLEVRTVVVTGVDYGTQPEYGYVEPGFFLRGMCMDRKAPRSFYIANITPGTLQVVL